MLLSIHTTTIDAIEPTIALENKIIINAEIKYDRQLQHCLDVVDGTMNGCFFLGV